MTAPGRRQDERDRLRGRLPGPGCHEGHDGVFPRRVHRRPPPAARAHQLPERQPGVRRVHLARIGTGERPAQPGRRPGGRPAGSAPASGGCGPAPPPDLPAPAASRAITQAPPMASAVAQPISTTAVAVTTAVGVCGHACAVRPCRTSLANFMPNDSVVPPVTTAASLAAAQISPQTATSDQQPISTAQPAARPAGSDRRARAQCPAHRGSPSWAMRMAWSVSYSQCSGPDQGELDRDAQPFAGLDQVLAAAGVAGAGLVGLRGRPRRDQRLFRSGQRGDLGDPGQLAGRQPGQDGDRGAVHEAAGLGPVLLGGAGRRGRRASG